MSLARSRSILKETVDVEESCQHCGFMPQLSLQNCCVDRASSGGAFVNVLFETGLLVEHKNLEEGECSHQKVQKKF